MTNSIKKLFSSLAILIALSVSAFAQRSAVKADEKYSPPGGGFEVRMPGRPVASEQEVPTTLGQLKNHMFIAEEPRVTYAVMYADFPDVTDNPELIKAMFDNGRDAGIASINGKLQNEKTLELSGYAGREWLATGAKGEVLRARVYWVKRRLYQVITLREAEQDPEIFRIREAEVQKFLDSFALLTEPTN